MIVTQSGIKSESMVSASYALEAYKDVYVFMTVNLKEITN